MSDMSHSPEALPASPPKSPIVPLQRRNRLAARRQSSLTDVHLQVTDRWDVSPKVRRNSLIFRKDDSKEKLVKDEGEEKGTAHHPELKKVLQEAAKEQVAEEQVAEEPKRSGTTLEDLTREGILEAAYSGAEYGWVLREVKDDLWIYRKTDGQTEAFKACCLVNVAPTAFISVLRDVKSMNEWDQWIEDCRCLSSAVLTR